MTTLRVVRGRHAVVLTASVLVVIGGGCSDDDGGATETTAPPTTAPPSTEPPSIEPPSTEPPSTEPPSTEPPATEPAVTAAPSTSAPEIDEALRAELLEMLERDQAVRTDLTPEDEDGEPLDWDRVDAEHARRMEEILDEHGWPGWSLVGEDGAFAAWVLIQHADLTPALQRRGLEMMQVAVDAGDADPSDLAYLIDRVRVAEGEPQVYGTQWDMDVHGELTPRTPIEDEAEVDARRAAVGLGTLEEYKEELRSAWG